MKSILRRITENERAILQARGCYAEDWDSIRVSEDFCTEQLYGARFAGEVAIESGARIFDSYVANYAIGKGSTIEGVGRLECREVSSFGNGVEVSPVNENGGRSILIYDDLKAQLAYLWTMNRQRTTMVERLAEMVREYARSVASEIGRVGARCRIIGARFIRECNIADDVVVDGASLIENATLLERAYIGIDVKIRDVIVAEDARVDTGATLERVFVGERVIAAVGFSSVDSLFFASSHFENGEAAAIFAGPYSVSHHKSSLLIAGIFSFFNAGSGTNQSNHLFKSGAVHQAVHPRGCKFASGGYVMSPAREGAFTMVKGHHSRHHDTSAFPYSYLIEDNGRSMLMPAANLVSYGTRRDIDKWEARDKRQVFRDIINYEEFNPYITGAMIEGVNALNTLSEQSGECDEYMWERAVIRRAQMRRGLGLYNKAIAVSIGAMLSKGERTKIDVAGRWIDVAGAYLPLRYCEEVMDGIESAEVATLEAVDQRFAEFATLYDDCAYTWARALLGQLLGHEASDDEVASAIEASKSAAAELERQVLNDKERDNALSMAVGYGNDSQDEEVRYADYRAVRGL